MYATTAQLARRLLITGTIGTEKTEDLTRAIQTAMAQIDGLCGRSFTSIAEVKTFAPLEPQILPIGYASVITSVNIDLDGDYAYETNIPASDYDLNTNEKGNRFVVLRPTATNTFVMGSRSASVSGTFGESAVPIEIEMVTLLQASRLWKRAESIFGEIRSDNGFMRVTDTFDPDGRQILKDAGWLRPRRMTMV